MGSPTWLTIVAATAVHCVASPIPEVSLELYVVPYLLGNLILYTYLYKEGLSTVEIIFNLTTINTCFLLTSVILTITRRLFFSPLAKFPGPKLAAISGFWNANEGRLGRASRTRKALHDKFQSDIIRIGPNELSVNRVDAIERLYGKDYRRGAFVPVFNISGGDNLVTQRDNQLHSVWRRMWVKAFSRDKFSDYLNRIQSHVNKAVRLLHEKAGNPVECGKFLDALTFDVISDIAFSQDTKFQDGAGDRSLIDGIHVFVPMIPVLGNLPHLQQICRYLPEPPAGRKFSEYRDRVLATRKSLKGQPNDIFAHLELPDASTGIRMRPIDLKQHILFMMIVGAHSVGTTLTRTLAVLASQPHVQSSIRQELNEVFHGEGTAPVETIRKLKYLDCVVREALRMFGPVTDGTAVIVPKGGITLESGSFIPGGTQVWVGQYVIMFNEEYFPRPHEFLPERWMNLGDEGHRNEGELVKDRRAWIPFGYGPHSCGGRALAIEELKQIVLKIVMEFDIRFVEHEDMPFQYEHWADSWKDYFLAMIDEIELRFVPR
ncbi:unnamed protein product [Clonostachys chloroleuca]|uniref:Cytochrome P450 n=1 Tax=Clonostachys chloroleuca TaxID=1926264 RepID=A0AA35Q357_9HYPO|nr:unnamed protein product [Clonostachys chloroleuca]